ncbi:hypothetical protein ER50_05380 [Bacillus safensis]|nr:hypothetical protein ER50_05380 [Bacillus safensis]
MTLEKAIANQLFYRYISVDLNVDVDSEYTADDTANKDEHYLRTRSCQLIGKYIERIYDRLKLG